MPISWIAFLTKLIPYVGQLDDIVEAIERIAKAEGLQEHWQASKDLGDILVPILASITGLSFETAEEAVCALKLGDGRLLGKLKDFFNSEFGQMLFRLLLGKLIPTA